jgi:hypothetical protein
MDQLAKWTSAVCADLGIEEAQLNRTMVLNMARGVRKAVMVPAAPVTAYLFGIAVGRGLSPVEAAARVDALAREWRGIDWSD